MIQTNIVKHYLVLWFLLKPCKGKYSRSPQPHHRSLLLANLGEIQNKSKALPHKKPNGDDKCPCLPFDVLQEVKPQPVAPYIDFDFLGPDVNVSTYGIGCKLHDVLTPICMDTQCATQIPLPADCDNFWCGRSWCFVDPDNCNLLSNPSAYYADRHFSYATCGEIDSFTLTERRKAVEGKTYQVAFNSNSGGWKGSYNPHGSFAVNDEWTGPIVDFIRASALEGGSTINITQPPDWLREESEQFFGPSSFDYCVYAVSLGYLDFCVGAYTITDKRAAVANFFETTTNGIYLISFTQAGGTSWDSFFTTASTIFEPFTWGVWFMIIFFSIPILSLLMLVHEYGAPGSAYPRTTPELVLGESEEEHHVVEQRVTMATQIVKSLYMGILSFFQESYDQSVVTVGGKIHLLAISSFVLLVLAVYTANLAAILTQDIQKTPVNDLAGALRAGYSICAERKIADIITSIYDIDPNRIVSDPVDEGGDGLPGFSCPGCAARSRVFDFMKLDNTNPGLYCDMAIASEEDLEVLHGSSKHCNKTRVGSALAYESVGIPIFSEVSPELVTLFHEMKNKGGMIKALSNYYSENTCPDLGGEGNSLTIEQMTGIWIIVFGFALVALIARFLRLKVFPAGKTRKLQRYDQWGNPTAHGIYVHGRRFDPFDGHVGKWRSKRTSFDMENNSIHVSQRIVQKLEEEKLEQDQYCDEEKPRKVKSHTVLRDMLSYTGIRKIASSN